MKVIYPIKVIWRDRFRFEVCDDRNLVLFRSMVENGDHYFMAETKALLERMCAGVNGLEAKPVESPVMSAQVVESNGVGEKKPFDRKAYYKEWLRKRKGKEVAKK